MLLSTGRFFLASADVPEQFGTSDWSVSDYGNGGNLTLTVSTLPYNGGSTITDLEYQLDGSGPWTSLGGETVGSYFITGLTDNQAYDVTIRAVNAVGTGASSSAKTVTPTHVDSHFASVSALLHFNGADGSTTFTDVKGNTWTRVGNTQIDTAESKFGGASGLFDGTGDYITTPDHTKFEIGSSDFTIEAWCKPDLVGGKTHTISNKRPTGTQNEHTLSIISSKPFFNAFSAGTTIVTLDTGGAPLAGGDWHHIAITRVGSNWRLFVDGVLLASDTSASAAGVSTSIMYIGRSPVDTTRDYDGWIDEFRFTKGVGRYTTDFPPPGSPFPDS